MDAEAPQPFRLDRDRAESDLRHAQDVVWAVNSYSDADELNSLLDAAQAAGLISAPAGARIYVYPLSICEPEPLLAASAPGGPTFLGGELGRREREAEDPVAFTLRLLTEAVQAANRLLAPPTSANRPSTGPREGEDDA